MFTVPTGGDGFYFFSFYFMLQQNEFATFDIRLNSDAICAAYGDDSSSSWDHATCTAVVYASAGKF